MSVMRDLISNNPIFNYGDETVTMHFPNFCFYFGCYVKQRNYDIVLTPM